MRSYRPFRPRTHHRLNAWRQPPSGVDLVSHGGHEVVFPDRRVHREPFRMRHYLFLGRDHGWRNGFGQLRLPSAAELRRYEGDDALDPSDPWDHTDLERAVVLR